MNGKGKISLVALGAMALAGQASAAISTSVETNALNLANALFAGSGFTINSATLSGHSGGGGASSGLFSAGANAYNLSGNGVVLSSGDVLDYGSGPNTSGSFSTNWGDTASAAEEALLDPITGGTFTHFDVTVLEIKFVPNVAQVGFSAVFGSDEYPEFVGSSFIDGLGFYMNGFNIAGTGDGPLNINHPMAAIAETELDGVAVWSGNPGNPLLTFGGAVNANVENTLTIIIADATDNIYDSTVYIQGFGIPAPGTLALLGLAGLVGGRRRR